MIVTIRFLFKSLNHFLKVAYNKTHTIAATIIRNKGNIPVKNTLNIAVEGVNPLIDASLKNQSSDKNASDDAPIFCNG